MPMNAKTEEQARTKFCPHVRRRVWPDEPSRGNEDARCIASECMMWDWKGLREASGNERTGFVPIN